MQASSALTSAYYKKVVLQLIDNERLSCHLLSKAPVLVSAAAGGSCLIYYLIEHSLKRLRI